MSGGHGTKRPSDGLPGTIPSKWFAARFPKLAETLGEAVSETKEKRGVTVVRNVSQPFLAATLSESAAPETPTVYLPCEQEFYAYLPSDGIYAPQTEPALMTRLVDLLSECARACRNHADTSALEFRLKEASFLTGVLKHARGRLQVPDDFFAQGHIDIIPCANGMLRVADRRLLPFAASYRRRSKLAVPFDPVARCPIFLDTVLRPQLASDDLDLLQRWFGLVMTGDNVSQTILMLTGPGGSGKGTTLNVLIGILGAAHSASLRADRLEERFETSSFLGKTLLYGPDVASDFLNNRAAAKLKSLTGGDLLTPELKNSNKRPSAFGRYNVVMDLNGRPGVWIDQDVEAWRRRLRLVTYTRSVVDRTPGLSKHIVASEGSGVLNWALEGLDRLRDENWQMSVTDRQQAILDDMLLESESVRVFLADQIVEEPGATLTGAEASERYQRFCLARGWKPVSDRVFSSEIIPRIERHFGRARRNDIPTCAGSSVRGWKDIRLK